MMKGKGIQPVGHTLDLIPDGGVYQLDEEAWPEDGDAVISKSGFSGDTKNTLSVLKVNHLPFKKWGLVIVLETFAEGSMAKFVPIVPLEPSSTNPVLHVPLSSPNFVPLPVFEPPLCLTNTWPSCLLTVHRTCVRFDRVFETPLEYLTPVTRPPPQTGSGNGGDALVNPGASPAGPSSPSQRPRLRLTSTSLTDLQWRMKRRAERQEATAEKALQGLDLSMLSGSNPEYRGRSSIDTSNLSLDFGVRRYPTSALPPAGNSGDRRKFQQRPGQAWNGGDATDTTAHGRSEGNFGVRELRPTCKGYTGPSHHHATSDDENGSRSTTPVSSRPTTANQMFASLSKQQQQQHTPDPLGQHGYGFGFQIGQSGSAKRLSKASTSFSEGSTLVDRSLYRVGSGSGGGAGGGGGTKSLASYDETQGGQTDGQKTPSLRSGKSNRWSASAASIISSLSQSQSDASASRTGSRRGTLAPTEDATEVELQPWKG